MTRQMMAIIIMLMLVMLIVKLNSGTKDLRYHPSLHPYWP